MKKCVRLLLCFALLVPIALVREKNNVVGWYCHALIPAPDLVVLPPSPPTPEIEQFFHQHPTDVYAGQPTRARMINAWVSPSLLVATASGGSGGSVVGAGTSDERDGGAFGAETGQLTWTQIAATRLRASDAKALERDEVLRVFDANTVKLKKAGLVTLAAVRTPSAGAGSGGQTLRFPDCFTRSPSYKVRQLLPKGAKVGVRFVDNAGRGGRPRAALVVREGGHGASSSLPFLVNGELVLSGFARPLPPSRELESAERALPRLAEGLASLQAEAKRKGVGLHQTCTDEPDGTNEASSFPIDDQFEPLDITIETRWGADGGEPTTRLRDGSTRDGWSRPPPPNPGDSRGCSDFGTYEDALRWFETYAPYYGDVAKLDRDGDGIPCPGLPHTTDQNRHRMKVPLARPP